MGITGVLGEKPLEAEMRINNKHNPHLIPSPEIDSQVTLVRGECSHHDANPAHVTALTLLPEVRV